MAKEDFNHVNIDGVNDLLLLTNIVGAGMGFFSALGFFSIFIDRCLEIKEEWEVKITFFGPLKNLKSLFGFIQFISPFVLYFPFWC